MPKAGTEAEAQAKQHSLITQASAPSPKPCFINTQTHYRLGIRVGLDRAPLHHPYMKNKNKKPNFVSWAKLLILLVAHP